MKRQRPGTVVLCAAALLVGGALIAPIPATAGGSGSGPGSGGRSAGCVTVVDASPAGSTGGTDSGADGIAAGPGGVWFSRGGTIDRVGRTGTGPIGGPITVPDATTADVGALAGSGSSV